MKHRTAMVVHADESTLRLISRGLNVFAPTHRVVTTDSLSSASDWIATKRLELLFLMGDDEHVEASITWMHRHDIDPSRVIFLGANGPVPRIEEATWIPEPVRLGALMAAVRASTERSQGNQV